MTAKRGFMLASGAFLILCFGFLIMDMVRFVGGGGQDVALTMKDLLSKSWRGQLDAAASAPPSTWSNVQTLVLDPVLSWFPIWAVFLGLALICRQISQRLV